MALIHVRGVGPGRLVSNVLAGLKVSALLIFIALGFTIGAGSTGNLAQAAGPVAGSAWLLALIPVMFTYSGWNAAAYVAEEIRDPGRNVPRALAHRHAGGRRDLPAAERAVPVRAAGRRSSRRCRAACSTWSPTAARAARRRHHGRRLDRQHRREHQRDDVRRAARLLRDGARRPVLPARRAASIRASRRRPTSIVAQAVWSGLLVLSGGANALTTYTGFCGRAVRRRSPSLALFVLRRASRTRRGRSRRSAIRSRRRSSRWPAR